MAPKRDFRRQIKAPRGSDDSDDDKNTTFDTEYNSCYSSGTTPFKDGGLRREASDNWEITPNCLCKEPSSIFTSKQSQSYGRDFYSCATRTCKYFRWRDQAVSLSAILQSSSQILQQQANHQKMNRSYTADWNENIVTNETDEPAWSNASQISPSHHQHSTKDNGHNINKKEGSNPATENVESATSAPISSIYDKAVDLSSEELLQKELSLSSKQLDVLKAILGKKNVFFSGAAGTGKSHVINVIKDVIKILGLESRFAFTATTGVAACNIGGVTIHSWSGIGTVRFEDKGEPELTIGRASAKKEVKRRWRTTDFLFIDEISMFSAELFDVLDRVGRRCREVEEPFGGIQIIVSGDFHQLPPIGLGSKVHHCFNSRVWQEIFTSDNTFILDQVFRQKDPLFTNILNDLRRGTVSIECDNVMRRKAEEFRMGKVSSIGGMKPTKLYPVNAKCDSVNSTELGKLTSDSVPFVSVDWGHSPYLENLKASCKAPEKLMLKVGTEVMLLKNLNVSEGFVNGARGVITKFVNRPHNCEPHIEFTKKNGNILPVVKFRVGDYDTEQIIKEDVFTMVTNNIEVASRTQLPLMLAWAISIHKSQGMTIQNVQVSIDGVFADGQGYVALSRCTSLEGLVLENWPRGKIKADPAVTEFYKSFGYSSEDVTRELVTIKLGDICQYHAEKAAEMKKKMIAAAAAKEADEDSGWLDPKKKKLSNYKAPKARARSAKEDAAGFFEDTREPAPSVDFNKFAYSSVDKDSEHFEYIVDDSDEGKVETNVTAKPSEKGPYQPTSISNDSDQGFVYYVDEDSNMTTDEPVVPPPVTKTVKISESYNTMPDPRTMSLKELKSTIESRGLTAKTFGFIEKHEFVALLLEDKHQPPPNPYAKSVTNGRPSQTLTPEQVALINQKKQAALDKKAHYEKNNL